MRTILILGLLLSIGCPESNDDTMDASTVDASTDGAMLTPCGAMCAHFMDLDCEEGKPFYDSDKPGPVGEPNTTCVEFCDSQMALGVDLNTACAAKAPTCAEIETYRMMMNCD